ncbi:MAG: DUF1295 domain-containing protein [Acidimicrobiia bacterium]|nr:DUF1295 domain-containing protein [Acidimicrobiia bacterium]MYC57465.1 DUF1295 domain-containing protein [Acidimicrobiia bacterium]MYG93691.1 DUF1295 domain-containing protein [Acidimicrobiia bacterium]MYI30047.1 DUF1295 domain-containing protein [Acidimicrobiia bacterium]
MVFGVSALVIVGFMLVVWGISVAIRDVSIVDISWGFGFVAVAWTAMVVTGGHGVRMVFLVAMVTVWGLRLTIYLAIRNIGKGEDYRYQAMRRRAGDRFWLISLGRVFGLQGAVMWVVSLPLQIGISESSKGVEVLWVIGAVIFVVGLLFEAVGDWQLARFKANPNNAGTIMDQGLWRYTRHPNYFGDATVWWGIGLVAASVPIGIVGLIGPAIMTWLLLKVSGVAMLERGLHKRRSGYSEYVERTSAFIPRRPKLDQPA